MTQYYTNELVARLMLKMIKKEKSPSNAIDICSGSWNLLREAYKNWNNIKLFGVDINPESKNNMINDSRFYCMDGREYALRCLKSDIKYDLLLANPPFMHEKNNHLKFKDLPGYYEMSKRALYRIETTMLLANLALLKDQCYLTAIIPETIINGNWAKCLRKYFLDNFEIQSIVFLPSNVFGKDISTAIIVLKKNNSNNDNITISKANINTNTNYISFQNKRIISKIDFEKGLITKSLVSYKTDNKLGLKIVRGNICSSQISKNKKGYPIIHSTDINNLKKGKWVPENNYLKYKSDKDFKYAEYNDILIIRVGRNCGEFAKLETEGKFLISDCIYLLKTKNGGNTNNIWNFLNSNIYKNEISKLKRGITTKYLTKFSIIDLINNNIIS